LKDKKKNAIRYNIGGDDLSWKQIIELLQQGEGPSIEFKKNLLNSIDLAKDLAAFSNAKGGYIVLGIDDKNGHLIGETVTKEWILAVAKAKCNPKLIPLVTEIEKANKNILLISVHEGNSKPYFADSKCYIRDNKITRLASLDEEKSLSANLKNIHEGLNKRQKDALNHVHENGSITNMIYRDLFKVSHKTAHIELVELLRQELLATAGKGRSTCYILPEIK